MPTIPVPQVNESFHISIYGDIEKGEDEDEVVREDYFLIAEVEEDSLEYNLWSVLVESENCWYEIHWDFNKARWEADPE